MSKAARPTCSTWENSDVLPPASVAVALICASDETFDGSVTLKDALPLESVVTKILSRNVSPSPAPDGSTVLFEKNSIVNWEFGVLFNEPVIVSVPRRAAEMTGQFWR